MIRDFWRAALVLSFLFFGCGGGSSPDGGLGDGEECPLGKENCGGYCADLSSDPQHCGKCFHACQPGEVCGGGQCLDECPEGYTECGGGCVDLLTNPEHCGACDRACRKPGAEGECVLGECVNWHCLPGYQDTDGDVSNGCEGTCAGRPINVSGALDYDLHAVHITGRVTVEGLDPGPSGSGGSRGTLIFKLAGSNKPVSVDLGQSGPATYQVYLFAGSYTIELNNSMDCPDGPFPCGLTVLRRGVSLNTDGNLDLDVAASETFEVTGKVTVNDATMGPSGSGWERGRLVFMSEEGAFASADLGTSGDATYRVTLSPGNYEISVENNSDCPDGAIPCQRKVIYEDLPINGPGVLDLDLEVIEVTGVVTVNELAMGTSATGGERAQIAFSDDEDSIAQGLGHSGSASYSLRLYAGTYDVKVSNQTDCPITGLPPVPCQTRTLRSGLALTGPGTLDLDLEVIEVTGAVTVNGGVMEDSATGGVRGRVRFQDDEGEVEAGLGHSGPVAYRVALFTGVYDVKVDNYTDCPQGAIPCQERLLREDLSLLVPGTLDLNLEVVTVSGQVTVNQADMGASVTGGERGRLVFEDDQGSVSVGLGHSGPATYTLSLYKGTYSVDFENTSDCPLDRLGVVPCQKRRCNASLQLLTDGSADFDLPVIQVTGAVTENGAGMPDSSNGQNRGMLIFEEQDEAGDLEVPMGSSGPATYQLIMFPGSYQIVFDNLACRDDQAVPCQRHVLKTINLTGNGGLDLDLPVITLSGVVTVNGLEMGPSPGSRSRGLVLLADQEGTTLMDDVGPSGPANYSVRLFAGTYDVDFTNPVDCPQGAVPCQTENLYKDLQLATDGVLDLALEVLVLSGQITLNQAAMPDSVSGVDRGLVRFAREETAGESLQAGVGTSGPATYQLQLYPGVYGVAFEGTDCPIAQDGATPCQQVLLEGCVD